jgi:hypothetical protein
MPTLGASARQDRAPVLGFHALAETVLVHAFTIVRLVGSFHDWKSKVFGMSS